MRDGGKCKVHEVLRQETDGLKQTWTAVRCMNPPYGREIGKWMHKALDSARAGAVVVCLVPARTDTAWWHDTVMQGGQIRFLRGRLKFGGGEKQRTLSVRRGGV